MARSSLPSTWYHDPYRYDEERRRIFGAEWLMLAPRAEVADPGDYVATVVAGWPIVVVNDGGTLRGFHNVCLHRAGPVVADGRGRARSFVCRYHGWAYGLDGTLLSARDFGTEVAAADCSLVPVSVATWRGLLFVNPDPGRANGILSRFE